MVHQPTGSDSPVPPFDEDAIQQAVQQAVQQALQAAAPPQQSAAPALQPGMEEAIQQAVQQAMQAAAPTAQPAAPVVQPAVPVMEPPAPLEQPAMKPAAQAVVAPAKPIAVLAGQSMTHGEDSLKQKWAGMPMLSSLGVAVAIHALIALAVGGYVVYEGIVPVPFFESDFDVNTQMDSAVEDVPVLIESEPLPEFQSAVVETVQEPGGGESGPDMSDLITVSSVNTSPSFSMPTTVGTPGLLVGSLTGGAGSGSGKGRGVGMGTFFGQKVSGNLAVILDISGSIDAEIFKKVDMELENNFQYAKKIGVAGSTFTDDNVKGGKLIPFEDSDFWGKGKSRADFQAVARGGNGYTYEHPKEGGTAENRARRKDGTPFYLQSHGKALELLLNSRDCPEVIYVISDFMDTVNNNYMKKIQDLALQTKVKIIFWSPFESWRAGRGRAENEYKALAEATGGEVKIGGL